MVRKKIVPDPQGPRKRELAGLIAHMRTLVANVRLIRAADAPALVQEIQRRMRKPRPAA